MYINNLVKLNIEGKFYLFADDTLVLFEGDNWDSVFATAEKGISKIKKWFDQNVLTLNVAKTKFIPISLRVQGDTLRNEIKIHSCGRDIGNECVCPTINRTENYKYLGVVFDSKLSWADHVSYLNKKIRKYIFAFHQLHQFLEFNEIKIAYFAYVQSLLEGGIIAWGCAYKNILQPLVVTQKSILKAALGRGRQYPSDALFTEMDVLDIRQLFIRTVSLYIFKHHETLLERPRHAHDTRYTLGQGVRLPRLAKTFSTTNCYYVAQVIYSNLPLDLRDYNSHSISVYKKYIVDWLKRIGRDRAIELTVSLYRQ